MLLYNRVGDRVVPRSHYKKGSDYEAVVMCVDPVSYFYKVEGGSFTTI